MGMTNAAAGDQAAPDKASVGPVQASAAAAAASSSSSIKVITGREYYEDLCFKAVNQCVGRVVRHKGDYAAVVLLDTRWVAGPAEWAAVSSSSGSGSGQGGSGGRRTVPVQKLPGWLQRSYVPTSGDFGPALKELAGFFRRQVPRAPA
jgi:chromosome transmission fidelity protein 1